MSVELVGHDRDAFYVAVNNVADYALWRLPADGSSPGSLIGSGVGSVQSGVIDNTSVYLVVRASPASIATTVQQVDKSGTSSSVLRSTPNTVYTLMSAQGNEIMIQAIPATEVSLCTSGFSLEILPRERTAASWIVARKAFAGGAPRSRTFDLNDSRDVAGFIYQGYDLATGGASGQAATYRDSIGQRTIELGRFGTVAAGETSTVVGAVGPGDVQALTEFRQGGYRVLSVHLTRPGSLVAATR